MAVKEVMTRYITEADRAKEIVTERELDPQQEPGPVYYTNGTISLEGEPVQCSVIVVFIENYDSIGVKAEKLNGERIIIDRLSREDINKANIQESSANPLGKKYSLSWNIPLDVQS